MTDPVTPSSSTPAQAPQARFLARVLVVGLGITFLVAVVSLTSPRKPVTFAAYQALDQASKPIDCQQLMDDLQPVSKRPGGYPRRGLVIDAEQQHQYSFKACRTVIDQEAASFCSDQVSSIMMGYDTTNPLSTRCVPDVRTAIRNQEPSLSVEHGWATLGALRLQLAQIVSVRVTPVAGFDAGPDAPQYLTLTTNAQDNNRSLYVLPDPATAQRWVKALTHDGSAS